MADTTSGGHYLPPGWKQINPTTIQNGSLTLKEDAFGNPPSSSVSSKVSTATQGSNPHPFSAFNPQTGAVTPSSTQPPAQTGNVGGGAVAGAPSGGGLPPSSPSLPAGAQTSAPSMVMDSMERAPGLIPYAGQQMSLLQSRQAARQAMNALNPSLVGVY